METNRKINVYEKARKELNVSREKASELMAINSKRIERIEYGEPIHPDEVLEMSKGYNKPDLCNYYCANECPIGQRYVQEVEIKDLSRVALQTLSSLNSLNKMKEKMIDICADGTISEEERKDFDEIRAKLNEISLMAQTIDVWFDEFVKDKDAE